MANNQSFSKTANLTWRKSLTSPIFSERNSKKNNF